MKSLAAALVLASSVHAAEPVIFSNPDPIRTGASVAELASADFNRDGKRDILFIDRRKAIVVLLGRGDGTFEAPRRTPTTGYGSPLMTVDINADAIPDVVLDDEVFNRYTIYLAKGDGTFEQAGAFTRAENMGFTLGQFTGDANADLVLITDTVISVRPGDGRGNFGAAVDTPNQGDAGGNVADVNGDGKLDLAGFRVYFGKGDGTFERSSGVSGAIGPFRRWADLNADGFDDKVWSDIRQNFVTVALGKGDGTFHPNASYLIAGEISDLEIADVNGDNRPDILTATSVSNHVSVLHGRGDGTFANAAIYVAGPGAFELAAGDFTGDGRPDLAVTGEDLVLLAGKSDGTLDAPSAYPLMAGAPETVSSDEITAPLAAVDVTGDGRLDVVTMTGASQFSERSIVVLPGLGGGRFGAPIQTPTGRSGVSHVTGDFNGDGKLDVIASDNFRRYFFAGKGDGTFAPAVESTGGFGPVADFTRDGVLDMLRTTDTRIGLYVGNGDGSFSEGPMTSGYPHTSSLRIAIADMNRDGVPDVVAGDDVLLADGAGRFRKVYHPPGDASLGILVAVADLDHDGAPDAILESLHGTLEIRRGRGDGSLHRATSFSFDVRRPPVVSLRMADHPVTVADVDADGNPDLAFSTAVLTGDGKGAFGGFEEFRYRGLPRSIAYADVDGNGRPDLLAIRGRMLDVILTGTGESRGLPTSVGVTSSHASMNYPGYPTLTAQAAAESTSYDLYGAVRFDADGRNVGIALLNAAGKGEAYAFDLSPGSYRVAGTFLRNDLYGESTAALTQTINKGTVTISVAAEPRPSAAGKPVTFTWDLGGFGSGAQPQTGTMTISAGSQTLGTVDVAAGSFTTSALPAGTHTITLAYSGDAYYQPSTKTYEHIVRPQSAAMTFTISPSHFVTEGQMVTLTVRFDPPSATGFVNFLINGVTAYSLVPVVNGVASITTPIYQQRAHVIRAVYSGDANLAGGSAVTTLVVGPAAPPLPRRRSTRH
jgi:Bacterial Ig-like domain (group 3)/FG-GAP-like repeat